LLALGLPVMSANATSRIKDLANIEGVRQNQLIGYGLVVGLAGTGDTLNNIPFTSSRCRRCSSAWASISAAPPSAPATSPP
jgi:flagellar basal body P-ring protein FlgI